tara:strand:+ start:1415 stop:1906 length:492 start_codon:yes stop_codon:yes gene_type:complete
MSWLADLLALVFLLVTANGSPVLARNLTPAGWNWPLDGGRVARDGYPLLGRSKTWRGLIVSVLVTGAAAALLGLGFGFGMIFGLMAMFGDLISSYLKRRRALEPSARSTGLDQFPEALLPMLLSHWWMGVGWLTVIVACLLFFIVVTGISPLLYRLGIRQRPH